MKWWQIPQATVLWTVLRLWFGFKWLIAGWDKITREGGFDASGFLNFALTKTEGAHPAVLGWYATFLERFALPNIEIFNFLVVWGEFLVGLGLIVGFLTRPALYAAALMNLSFLLAGETGVNPVYYTVAIILLVVGSSTYYWGVDRFALPVIKKKFFKKKEHATVNAS